jgi:branched-subunit amino acid transport protein
MDGEAMSVSMVITTVMLMGFVTLLCRYLPFAVLGKLPLTAGWALWMRYLPIAILASVVAPELFLASGGGPSLRLVAAIPTVLVAFQSRNLLLAVIAGVASLALMRGLL